MHRSQRIKDMQGILFYFLLILISWGVWRTCKCRCILDSDAKKPIKLILRSGRSRGSFASGQFMRVTLPHALLNLQIPHPTNHANKSFEKTPKTKKKKETEGAHLVPPHFHVPHTWETPSPPPLKKQQLTDCLCTSPAFVPRDVSFNFPSSRRRSCQTQGYHALSPPAWYIVMLD